MLQSDNIGSWAMFGLGVVMLIVILFRRSARYHKKLRRQKTNPRDFGKKEIAPARQPLADAPTDVLKWQVEMHETARDLNGELAKCSPCKRCSDKPHSKSSNSKQPSKRRRTCGMRITRNMEAALASVATVARRWRRNVLASLVAILPRSGERSYNWANSLHSAAICSAPTTGVWQVKSWQT